MAADGASDMERLKAGLKHAQKEFGDFVRYIAPSRIEDLEASTLRAMLTGEDRPTLHCPNGYAPWSTATTCCPQMSGTRCSAGG